MINRKLAPPIQDAVNFKYDLKPLHSFRLDNGIDVHCIHSDAQEVVALDIVFYAGNWYEEKNLQAAATNFLIKNGTSQKSAYVINEDIEFYGAYLNRACYSETATITLHCLSKYLNDLLPIVHEVIADAIYPEEELEIYKRNQRQRLKVNLQKCDFVGNRRIDEYLYGAEHPYGKSSSFEDYEQLSREDLLAFYRNYYLNGHCIIFAAGKLPADFEFNLNKVFGQLSVSTQRPLQKEFPLNAAEQKKHRIIIDDNGVQGAVRLATHFPNRHHPDFVPAQVLNTLFGGFFGSRLMANIREEKGYTYGIHSFIQNHIHQCGWMISTEAGRDVCEATIQEVYKEMERLRTTAVTNEELQLVKNFMLGSILGDLDGPFQIIGRWKNYILNDLKEDYFHKTIHTIKNIGPDELQQLAQRYLRPEDFYELIVV